MVIELRVREALQRGPGRPCSMTIELRLRRPARAGPNRDCAGYQMPKRTPAVRPGSPLVEAGGQRIRSFRHGLDYAFIRGRRSGADAERVIPRCRFPRDPSFRPGKRLRRIYESLQGRPEVGPLPTPRRCHAAPERAPSGFADVSSVLQPDLAAWCDPSDRTPVRKP